MCQFSYAESSFIYTAPVHNNSSLHLILYLTLNHAYCNKIPIITQIILEMFLPQIRKNHKDWNQCKNSPAVNIYNIIYKIIINGPPKFSVLQNDSNIYKRAERWMCDWSAPLTEWGAEETAALFSRTHRGSRNLFPRKVLCFSARRDARAARCWQPLRRAPSISTSSAKPFKIRCKRPSQLLTKRDELHRNRNELGAVKWPHCLLSRLQDLVFVLILFLNVIIS